ncbi:MAG TPA: NADPH:quinone oxidoreductase family protein [Jatrophihabitans sp.]|nr:NADPH:quinone oxidoreductase family protein [Jatrophihabitans sp.]
MRAVQITEFGGPETLVVRDLPDPQPAGAEVVMDVVAAGVNYADTHQTEDSYLAKQSLPLIPGGEVVARDESGRRLLGLVASGGYAQKIAADPRMMFPVPDTVTDAQALATLVQGATAWHLLRTSTHLQPGETVVVHAGAGGVGTLAIQLAKLWGAGRVIATASSEEKRALTLELGADFAIDSRAAHLNAALREANEGRGVDIVLEMTGGQVFNESLAALAPLGRLAVFGMAGRTPATAVDPAVLMRRSIAVIGFWLVHVAQRPYLLAEAVTDLMELIGEKSIRPVVGETYPLDRAADAHRALRDRTSIGKLVIDPQAES